MKENLNRLSPYLPWLGLGLIAAGALITLITRRFDPVNNLLLGGGALVLLLFAVARPDQIRAFVSGRQARYGASTILSILFFAAIGVLLYWLAYQNDDWRIDVTETGEFTPPPETVELLEGLQEPIHVIGFYTVSLAQQRSQAETLLENLSAISDQITYEFKDPEANPLLAEQYELNFNGTLVFIRNYQEENEIFARASGLADRDVHAALVEVVNPVDKNLYVITGHGEPGVESFDPQGMGNMVGLLEDQGFTVQELNLFTAGEVPDDATLIALIGPQAPLDPAEVEAIQNYLDGGGSAFIARDVVDSEGRSTAEEDGLNAYLRESWGLRLRNDVVVDQDLARAGQSFGLDFLAAGYGDSPIITPDLNQFSTRFSLARSIELQEQEGVAATPLVQTSADAWGETDIANLSQGFAEPNEGDAQGVLNIGVSAERTGEDSRLVLFGDADFVTNENLVWGGNSLLFSNALNWLADDETAIDLTPRETVQRQVTIPEQQLRLLRFVSTWFGPLLMGFVGFLVWSVRRRNV